MQKRIKYLIAAVSISMGLMAMAPIPTFADSAQSAVCNGIGLAVNDNGNCATADPNSPSVESLIRTVINILSYVVGVVAVIMIILGAFKYITSSGDAAKVTSAKNTIMYALIGVVVAALAQVLVHFVFVKATTPTPAPSSPPASVGKP